MASRPDRGRDARVCVAQIGAAHGLAGEVRLRSFTAAPDGFAHYGPLETEDRSRSLEIETLRPGKNDFLVRFRGIEDRTAAEALRNVALFVARQRLPAPDEGEFYHADLIGLAAVTRDGEALGEVVALHNFGAGDIVELRLARGGTLMLAFDAATVPQVDIAGGRIVVVPPADAAED